MNELDDLGRVNEVPREVQRKRFALLASDIPASTGFLSALLVIETVLYIVIREFIREEPVLPLRESDSCPLTLRDFLAPFGREFSKA